MKNTKKIVALALAAVMLVCTTVAATVAYLTSTTGEVENTFEVGTLSITLDEAVADKYGVVADPKNRTDGNVYKLIPGHDYDKDPTVHVAAGSEECYVFVKVVNGIEAIEAAGTTTIKNQMLTRWTLVNEEKGIWRYNTKVDARTAAQDCIVFESFKLANDADTTDYAKAKITILACAIQADGLDATTAYNNLPTAFVG